jgi:hypothetical protein
MFGAAPGAPERAEPLDHVASLMELAPLDRRVSAEGAANDFAQRLGAVDDEQPTDGRVEPALDQMSISACTTAALSVAPSTRPSRLLLSRPSNRSAQMSVHISPRHFQSWKKAEGSLLW